MADEGSSMKAPETEESQGSSGETNASSVCGVFGGDTDSSSSSSCTGSLSEPFTDPCDEFGDDEMDLEDGDGEITGDHPKTLRYARVLSKKGSAAIAREDFVTAAECFSRVLEIWVAHYGELHKTCFSAYYFYGFALLRIALLDLCPITPAESTGNRFSSYVENDESSDAEDSAIGLKEEENDEIEFDTEDTPNNDEDESELDLAWQLLDIARVIIEKRPTQSMDNVHVLCALAEVNNYRDDLTTCLLDYQKAIQILESLGEPDLMFAAKTYYRMGLCLETGSMTEQTAFYYGKALSCCQSNLELLVNEFRSLFTAPMATVPGIQSLISTKRQEIARVNDYHGMLKLKIQEEEKIQKKHDYLRRAIGALSGKVRQLEENGCSTSASISDDKVIDLGKVGGSVKMDTAGMYSDSVEPKLVESET